MEETNRTPTFGQSFASLALGMAPFSLLLGVSALFGADTVSSGGQNVHGIGALVIPAVLNVVFAAIFAGLQQLGFWIWSLLRRKRSKAET